MDHLEHIEDKLPPKFRVKLQMRPEFVRERLDKVEDFVRFGCFIPLPNKNILAPRTMPADCLPTG